jgi:hypothetical protein
MAHHPIWKAMDDKEPFEFFLHRECGKARPCPRQQVLSGEADGIDPCPTAVSQPLVCKVDALGLVRRREDRVRRALPAQATSPDAKSLGLLDSMHRLEVHSIEQGVNPPESVRGIRLGKLQDLLAQRGFRSLVRDESHGSGVVSF